MEYFKNIIRCLGSTIVLSLFVACGGGGGTSSVQAPAAVVSAPSNVQNNVTSSKIKISGQITFDHLPHKTNGLGLNYDGVQRKSARGIVVVLLDDKDSVILETVTDAQGYYQFDVETSKTVKVQAWAQMRPADNQGADNQWNVKITDNTEYNGLYVLEGSLQSSGTKDQIRDLHASLGWDGIAYTQMRAAGPFAILDPVYDTIYTVLEIDPTLILPPLEYRWSIKNVTILGDKTKGHIGTSGYHKNENAIYLLGEDGRDTDEFDPHVIIHEWGHYFEHRISRLDSPGGLHSLRDKLDARVAFSEGWANALSAIITNDPNYKDSMGELQSSSLEIDFENYYSSRAGWFNEGSIAAILYDIYDRQADEHDYISVGFKPIYQAMVADNVRHSDVFVTIFSFSDALLDSNSVSNTDYALLLDSQNISAFDALGSGEDNNGAIVSALPVYKQITLDDIPVKICSVDDAGNYNKLGNREFVFFEIPVDGNYQIDMTLLEGPEDRDPDFNLWQKGNRIFQSTSTDDRQDQFTGQLTQGLYVVEAFDYRNISGTINGRGDSCYALSVISI